MKKLVPSRRSNSIITEATNRPGKASNAITVAVNGVVKQQGDLGELIWSVNETIEQLSAAWVLAPGDLIFTGTPAGVGAVVRGDVMEGAIAGLPTLKVAVV